MAQRSQPTGSVRESGSRFDENLPEHYNPSLDRDNNLPEPFEEQGKEVAGAHGSAGPLAPAGYLHIQEPGTQSAYYASDQKEPPYIPPQSPAKKILGLRRRYFYAILVAILVVIIGAVLGGVLGSKSSNGSGNDQSQSAGTATSLGAGASATGGTSSPIGTSSVVTGKTNFKYPSVAVAETGAAWHVYMFALHASNNSITFHIKSWNKGWQHFGAVPIEFTPLETSPISAISWANGTDKVRLYYFDKDSRVIETQAQCNTSTVTCEWNTSQAILTKGPASTSGLGVLYWGNGSNADPYQIRLYYADDKDYMFELSWDQKWKTSASNTGFTAQPGTGLAAQAEKAADPVIERVFYADSNDDVKGLYANPPNALKVTGVQYSTNSVLSRPANVATCLYPSTDRSLTYLTVKQIAEDGSVVEARKVSNQGDWGTNTGAVEWDRADDAGGAIGCAGWTDQNKRSNQLLVYAVNGTMMDYHLLAGVWNRTTIFSDSGQA